MPEEIKEKKEAAIKPKKETTAMPTKIEAPEFGKSYRKGEKVKGAKPPHGGKWEYSPDKDELTLVEEPTISP